MKKIILPIFLLLTAGFTVKAQQVLRIACIGDSLTWGAGLPSREMNNYPAQLQNMLGASGRVLKFGEDDLGKTIREVRQFQPDIITICLGSNIRHLVKSFRNLPKHPRIILLSRPALPQGSRGSAEDFRRLASRAGIECIDLQPVVNAKAENFQDKFHLSPLGATGITRRLYEAVAMKKAAPVNVFRKLNARKAPQDFMAFETATFRWQEKNVTIVRPQVYAAGYPWAWITGQNKDTANAAALLERGFHIVFSGDTLNGLQELVSKAGLSDGAAIAVQDYWRYGKNGAFSKLGTAPANTPLAAILRATGNKVNFATVAAPGSEYRSAAGWKPGKDWWGQHADIDSLLRASPGLDVLFIGNSITQGIGGHRTAVTSRPGFAAFDAIMKGRRWECAGISGDRTQNVLWRLQNGAYRDASPRLIVLTIGVNNFPDDAPAEIAEGIRKMLDWTRAQMPSSAVLLVGPLPAGLKTGDMRRVKYEQTQAIISKYSIPRVHYLDLSGTFILPDGSLNPELCAGDGIHLRPAGYKAWAKALLPVIDNILQ